MPDSSTHFLVILVLLTAFEAAFAQGIQSDLEATRARLQERDDALGLVIRVHPSITLAQTEVPIATHPRDPKIVLGGWISNPLSGNLLSQRLGVSRTIDGGVTWMGKDTLPVSPARTSYDPIVAIDLNGNFFFGGVYRSPWEIIIAKSSDFGATWSSTSVPKPTPAFYEDKPHMTVDVNPGSPYENFVYVSYTGGPCSTCLQEIMFSRSVDRGSTFSTPISINGSVTGTVGSIGANLAVGPNSELYAVWSAFDRWPPAAGDTLQLGFNESTDGGTTWQGPKSILRMQTLPATITKGGNCIRAGAGLPSMAVDRSAGSRRGWLYVVYAAVTATKPDILLIRSTDGGTSWSAPIRVNQDISDNDQWLPWINVDPLTGYLYAIYYDSRSFPANDSADVYISRSIDGGETFADSLVSDVPFLPRQAMTSTMTCYMGDYIGVVALNDTVWAFWNDNRTGIHQAYIRLLPTISAVEATGAIPSNLSLKQNYPNPFNPSTTIEFELTRTSHVILTVYDLLGREVSVLANGGMEAGIHEVKLDATELSSGVYLYRLTAGSLVQTRKMIVVK